MAQIYVIAAWASLLFALPLYMTRLAYQNYTEMREMFTQTITALAEAVDKRDPFTSKHSWRVKEIGGDIGRTMRLNEAQLEALEWGGLLHDVGKIGVPDAVLLKQDRLTKEERAMMNSHPVLGAQIIQGVTRLAPELPIIRHHHEWYNGSGYPDRLIGDEIPLLARVLHVADSFEAMTAARPYRMTPLTPEQAIARAAQVRRHPVRPQGGGRVRPDELGGGRRGPGPHDPGAPDPADLAAREPARRRGPRAAARARRRSIGPGRRDPARGAGCRPGRDALSTRALTGPTIRGC